MATEKFASSWVDRLLALPREEKRVISVLFDLVAIPAAIVLSTILRRGSYEHLLTYSVREWFVIALTGVLSVIIFSRIGLYRAVLRYLSGDAVRTVLVGASLSALAFASAVFLFKADFSRSSIFIYLLITILTVGGSRFLARAYILRRSMKRKEPVIIFGAGAAGRQLASALVAGQEYSPVAFVDESPNLYMSKIQGLTVYSLIELMNLIQLHNVKQVLLAVPSATRARRQEIIKHLETFPLKVQSIAGMADIVSGKTRIEELHDIDIEDLLGRDPVPPFNELLSANIADKIVMVTGAGGSIGSELCRQILAAKPEALVLFESSEYSLYAIEQELSRLNATIGANVPIITILSSVQNKAAITSAMHAYRVQTVYHAAAYKHVPMVEFNVIEGIRNNVFGTWYTAQAAIEAGVETFVLISTDKAVRPTNVMGASKRMAELCLQALARRDVKTRFCMVRFGNVLGSSGSVVPLFKKQIADGGPVTVTHQDIIRYFMTIPEAAQLVIQAGAMGRGGDVFVLDMGEPVKIADLARRMIKLMGLTVKDEQNQAGDIEIKFSGLRPGEKLYEELLIGNNVTGTDHPRILRAEEKQMTYKDFVNVMNQLQSSCATGDVESVRKLLVDSPTDFTPNSDIVDAVWCQLKSCNEAPSPAPGKEPGDDNVVHLH